MKQEQKDGTERHVLRLGKVAARGGWKVNAVELELELRTSETGVELSICGSIWNNMHTDIVSGGQNIDEIAKLFPRAWRVQRIKEIWQRWHLNHLHAGCEHQRADWDASEQIEVNGERKRVGWVYETEHPRGLLMKKCATCGYAYGSAWLKEEIPSDVLREVRELFTSKDAI